MFCMKLETVALSMAAKASVVGRKMVKGPSCSRTGVRPAPVTATLAPVHTYTHVAGLCVWKLRVSISLQLKYIYSTHLLSQQLVFTLNSLCVFISYKVHH